MTSVRDLSQQVDFLNTNLRVLALIGRISVVRNVGGWSARKIRHTMLEVTALTCLNRPPCENENAGRRACGA